VTVIIRKNQEEAKGKFEPKSFEVERVSALEEGWGTKCGEELDLEKLDALYSVKQRYFFDLTKARVDDRGLVAVSGFIPEGYISLDRIISKSE
jgi:hypothetical protein